MNSHAELSLRVVLARLKPDIAIVAQISHPQGTSPTHTPHTLDRIHQGRTPGSPFPHLHDLHDPESCVGGGREAPPPGV